MRVRSSHIVRSFRRAYSNQDKCDYLSLCVFRLCFAFFQLVFFFFFSFLTQNRLVLIRSTHISHLLNLFIIHRFISNEAQAHMLII